MDVFGKLLAVEFAAIFDLGIPLAGSRLGRVVSSRQHPGGYGEPARNRSKRNPFHPADHPGFFGFAASSVTCLAVVAATSTGEFFAGLFVGTVACLLIVADASIDTLFAGLCVGFVDGRSVGFASGRFVGF